jgi:hypothetical protein
MSERCQRRRLALRPTCKSSSETTPATIPIFPNSSFLPTLHSLVTLLTTLLVVISFCIDGALAQLVNGQFFTSGLAITNSPFPASTFNIPSNIPISVEVTGDGRIPPPSDDFKNQPTAFVSLNIFLISAPLGLNATISVGRKFLMDNPESTTKRLSWPIPDCLPSGPYNLTFYEVSRINSTEFFSITPIPIGINNPANPTPGPVTSPCPGVLPSVPISQPSSPPPFQPFLGPDFSATTLYGGGFATVTAWTIITTRVGSATVTVTASTGGNRGGSPTLVPISGAASLLTRSILSSCLLASVLPLCLIAVAFFGL